MAGKTMRFATEPELLEPLIFHPEISSASVVRLKSSMNSSLAPFGPRVRNSLITIGDSPTGKGVGLGTGVGVSDGDGIGVGVAVGAGVGVG